MRLKSPMVNQVSLEEAPRAFEGAIQSVSEAAGREAIFGTFA